MNNPNDLTLDILTKEIELGQSVLYFTTFRCNQDAYLINLLIEDFKSREEAKFFRVDCSHSTVISNAYEVYDFPALLLMEDGKMVDSLIGNEDHNYRGRDSMFFED